MTDAIQSDRNNGSPSGAQAEIERLDAGDSATGMLIISAMNSLLATRYHRKRPLASPPGAHGVNQNPDYQNERSIANLTQCAFARYQHIDKPGCCHDCGQRVQPHPKRPWQLRASDTQYDQSHSLDQILQNDTNYHQGSNQICQPEETKQPRNAGQSQQRNIGELVDRVYLRKCPKIVSVERRRI